MASPHPATNAPVCVAARYRFARFGDPASLRGPLLDQCNARGKIVVKVDAA